MKIEIDYRPHRHQQQFRLSNHRFKALISGIGGGKSFAGAMESLEIMLQYPGVFGAIIAPTYAMLRDVTRKMFIDITPHELIQVFNKGDNQITLVNGSSVIFRSADDPEKLRGPNLGFFWIDEAALVSKRAWDIMIGRLRQPPEKGFITSTPKGYNWIWSDFVDAPLKDPTLKDIFWHITFGTSENPYLSQEYISSINRKYTGAFKDQEFYGMFVGFEGLVYPMFKRDVHVVTSVPENLTYYSAHDFGYTNPAVCLAVGADSDGRLYVTEEFYQKGCTPETYIKASEGMRSQYNFVDGAADPASPDYIRSLIDAGFNVRGVKCGIMEGNSELAQRLTVAGDDRPRLYVHERCVYTIMEFENYRFPERKDDQPVQEKPLDVHNHSMASLRYLSYMLNMLEGGTMKVIGSLDDIIGGGEQAPPTDVGTRAVWAIQRGRHPACRTDQFEIVEKSLLDYGRVCLEMENAEGHTRVVKELARIKKRFNIELD